MKLSIVIPIYNVEPYLKKCLDSVLAQTITDWECILVDDGSTDKSGTICDEYVARDPRFKVIHKSNGGVASARNDGITKATGKYLGFIDPDDYISNSYYQILINAADKNPDYIIQSNKVSFGLGEIPKPGTNTKLRLRDLHRIAGAVFRVLYDTNIIKKYNIRMTENLSFYEDAMFNIEYAQLSRKKGVGFIDANYYHLFARPNSICGLTSDNYGINNRALRSLPLLRNYYTRAVSENWNKSLIDKMIPMILEAEEVGTKRIPKYNPNIDIKFMSIGGNCSIIDTLGDKRIHGPIDNFRSMHGLSTCNIILENKVFDSLYYQDIVTPVTVGKDEHYQFNDYLIHHHMDPYSDKFKSELASRIDTFNAFISDIRTNNEKYLIYSLNEYDVDENGIESDNFINGLNYLKSKKLLDKVIFLGNISVGNRHSYNYKLKDPSKYNIKYIEMYIDEEDKNAQKYTFNKLLSKLLQV